MNFFTTLLCFGFLNFINSKNITKGKVSTRCTKARDFYTQAGYPEKDIYITEQNETLKVCSASPTCCSQRAEANLFRMSENQRKIYISPQPKRVKEIFHDNNAKFKDLFRDLLRKSQKRLDTMFRDTYKSRYVENIHVFNALYIAFNQYVNGSELLIKEKVDTFFAEVHKIVYMMTQPFAKFSDEYKNCIYDSTNYVQPFGDMQRKIGYQTSRPFLASRVFLQGLKTGLEVISDILGMTAHDECSIALLRMTQCPICRGVTDAKPCHNYCVNVMKGCFAYIVMIQQKWDEYITNMISLASKLEGPFNLEAAIEPLGVKISDAIMTFQDNQSNVTAKVEEKCGKAPLKNSNNLRRRRNVETETKSGSPSNGDFRTWVNKISESKDIFKKFKQETQYFINNGYKVDSTLTHMYSKRKNASAFEQLVSKTSTDLEGMRHFWIELSENLCRNGIASPGNTKCWNGVNTTGYIWPIVGDAVHDLFSANPEMKLSIVKPNTYLMIQVDKLTQMIKKIKIALTGEERTDTEEGSGQVGSGDVSGENEGSGEVILPPDEGSASSGSGIEPVYTTRSTTKTKDKCANSVDQNCHDKKTATTTHSPNDIPKLPSIDDNPNNINSNNQQQKDPRGASQHILANVLLLWISSLVALWLL